MSRPHHILIFSCRRMVLSLFPSLSHPLLITPTSLSPIGERCHEQGCWENLSVLKYSLDYYVKKSNFMASTTSK